MSKTNSKIDDGKHRAHRGIWHAQPRLDKNFFGATSHTDSPSISDISDAASLGLIEPEIRSHVKMHNNGRRTIDNAREVVGDAVLLALDSDPLWTNHLLTKRRPNLEEISWVLADAFDWMPGHLILPFEDLVVVIRLRSMYSLEACAIVTVEPTYAGGEVCYWLRCSIYEGSENTSLLIYTLRCMVSYYDILDYPDANLLDSLNFSFVSKASIAAYAAHPERTQSLFLLPRSANDTNVRKVIRMKMAGALFPFGIIGELSADGIREITGEKPPREMCAFALPPKRLGTIAHRIVLGAPKTKNDDRLRWSGMSEYLTEYCQIDAPWLSDSYEMRPAQAAAVGYARLLADRKAGAIRSYRPTKETQEHIRSTTEQPGWDLYSPLPSQENRSEPLDDPQLTSVDDLVTECAQISCATERRAVKADPSQWAVVEIGYPSSLDGLSAWAERLLSSALEIAPRAIREMKKFRHPQPQRIAEALELLAGPRLATFRGDRSAAQSFHQGLAKLRMRDGFSGAERLAGQTGSDYLLSHHGKTFFLDRHLASNSSGFNDPKMIRIYYFYDPGLDKIIVGWLPTHLQTSKS